MTKRSRVQWRDLIEEYEAHGIQRSTFAKQYKLIGVIRLGGSILMEQHDEWAAAERRYMSSESMPALYLDLMLNTDNEDKALTP